LPISVCVRHSLHAQFSKSTQRNLKIKLQKSEQEKTNYKRENDKEGQKEEVKEIQALWSIHIIIYLNN
jgi:hypothetical protein